DRVDPHGADLHVDAPLLPADQIRLAVATHAEVDAVHDHTLKGVHVRIPHERAMVEVVGARRDVRESWNGGGHGSNEGALFYLLAGASTAVPSARPCGLSTSG